MKNQKKITTEPLPVETSCSFCFTSDSLKRIEPKSKIKSTEGSFCCCSTSVSELGLTLTLTLTLADAFKVSRLQQLSRTERSSPLPVKTAAAAQQPRRPGLAGQKDLIGVKEEASPVSQEVNDWTSLTRVHQKLAKLLPHLLLSPPRQRGCRRSMLTMPPPPC